MLVTNQIIRVPVAARNIPALALSVTPCLLRIHSLAYIRGTALLSAPLNASNSFNKAIASFESRQLRMSILAHACIHPPSEIQMVLAPELWDRINYLTLEIDQVTILR